MRKVIPAAVAVAAALALTALGAIAILLTVLLGTASAAPQPVGTTVIGTGTGTCLRGATYSGTVKVAACDPSRRSQQWDVTRAGRYRLHGTKLYAVAGAGAVTLGPWAQASCWVYANHLVMASGQFLTWPGTGEPVMSASQSPGDTWYEFTRIAGP